MLKKIKEWGTFILSIIGIIAIIELIRRSGDTNVADISEEIKQKEDLLEKLNNIDTSDMKEQEITEWLNKR